MATNVCLLVNHFKCHQLYYFVTNDGTFEMLKWFYKTSSQNCSFEIFIKMFVFLLNLILTYYWFVLIEHHDIIRCFILLTTPVFKYAKQFFQNESNILNTFLRQKIINTNTYKNLVSYLIKCSKEYRKHLLV